MPRKALIADTMTGKIGKEKTKARNAVEDTWRRGNLEDYEPISLTEDGMKAFEAIAMAIPDEALSTIDGYTIEIAANAFSQMVEANEHIIIEGQVVIRYTRAGENEVVNPYVSVYAKYAEIFKRYLVELGCTPSARAKIAADAAKQLARPAGVRARLAANG